VLGAGGTVSGLAGLATGSGGGDPAWLGDLH